MSQLKSLDLLAEDQANAFISALYAILDWLAAIATVCFAAFAVYATRPRVVDDKSVVRYIDYKNDLLIEETEYFFKWGKLYEGKITIPKKLPRNVIPRVYYKPRIAYKQELPHDNYEEKATGAYRTVKIVGKDFFDDAETDCVYVLTSLPQDTSYRNQIFRENETPDGITITNHNLEEIRNYSVELPTGVDLVDLPILFTHIESFDTTKSGNITVVLKPIPAKQGDAPSKTLIPFKKSS